MEKKHFRLVWKVFYKLKQAWKWIFHCGSCYWTFRFIRAALNRRMFVTGKNVLFQERFRAAQPFLLTRKLIYRVSLQTYKDLKIHKAADCGNETLPVKVIRFQVKSVNRNLVFSGTISVQEDRLPLNLEFEVSATRCNLDKTGCVLFNQSILSKFCEKLNTETSTVHQIMTGFKPALQCPIKRDVYEFENQSKITMNMVNFLPEGNLWRCRILVFEKKGRKRLRPLACAEYEVSIVTKSHRPK